MKARPAITGIFTAITFILWTLVFQSESFALTYLASPLQITSTTTLQDDYVCDTTCFVLKGNNFTLDFNGHTATFGNANAVTVPNDTFSSWTDGNTPASWTVVSGTATKTASIYPFGPWDVVVSPTASLKSTAFTLTGGKTYLGFAFARGSSSDSYTLELKKASDDTVLFTVTVTGGLLNRGYADEGQTNFARQYKPAADTDVYLQFTGIGTSNKTLGMITIKPAYDYGILQASYQSTYYEPDGPTNPNYYGASNNVTIKNGTLTQGAGNGVRTDAIRYSTPSWTIDNMTVNMNGINTNGILCSYCSATTINNSTVNSTSLSVFNRMHGAFGIGLSTSSGGGHTITNNTIYNVPQYGLFYYSCFAGTDTYSSTISGNRISQNELVTEGYAIGLSGVINTSVDNNMITPIKGRGILIDAANGCTAPLEKGTKNVTISNNSILGLYETRNAEYGEDALEVAGIRVRNWGGSNGRHENLTIYGNTITAGTDANGVHRAYGININANAPTDSISIYNNNVTVSATGAGRDANALSLQSVDMTTGGTLDIHDNTFTCTHQAVRFGGNDGSSVKGVTLRSNTLVQTGTPTVAPIAYGYWIGPETGNSLLDMIYNTSYPNRFCWDTSGQSDLTVKWSANVTVRNALNQIVPGATVTATDSKLNSYTGVTDSNGFVSLPLPEYKKEGKGSGCSTAGLTTTTYAPYKLSATKNADTSIDVDFAGTAAGTPSIVLIDKTLPVVNIFTAPATSTSLTVPGITLTATDNIGVTGYLINESATPPAAVAVNSAQPPTSYTASSAGNKTLYAWVRDAAGNVSAAMTASVNIDSNVTTPPHDGIIITAAGKNAPDISDALAMLRHIVSLSTLDSTQLAHADVAPLGPDGKPLGNGVVDVADVIMVLRRAIGAVSW